MAQDLLTTREVAKLLGVGTTSVKRWADSGLLRCVKTPGGHRRFRREDVEVFIAGYHQDNPGDPTSAAPPREDGIFKTLVAGDSTDEVIATLASQREQLGSWCAVAESVAVLLEEIGDAWARGEISVIQEHVASERLIRALRHCSDRMVTPDGAPVAMLLVAENDLHTIGLHLVEMCLREAGWNAVWVGQKTPVAFACQYILQRTIDLVAVSASAFSTDRMLLTDQADRLGAACQKRGVPLLLGGTGLWPERPRYGVRLRSFSQFRDYLGELSELDAPPSTH